MLSRIRTAQMPGLRSAAVAAQLLAAGALLLSACSTDGPLSLRPDVDLGEHTASLAPVRTDAPAEQPIPRFETVMPNPDPAPPAFSGVETVGEEAPEAGPAEMSTPETSTSPYLTTPLPAPEMSGAAPISEPDTEGAAAEDKIVPLAVETDLMASGEPTADPAPEIGTTEPIDAAAAATESAAPVSEHHIGSLDELNPVSPAGNEAPTEPYLIASLPRVNNPVARPRNVMPADEIDCRAELKKLSVAYQDLPRIHDGAACGIDYPVKVSAIGKVKMVPAATLTCDMAATFARWTRKELVPAAKRRYFTGVKAIHQASSYSCRDIARTSTLSEHGKGNALDVSRIELNSGRDIDVKKPGLFAFRQKGFLNSVRSDGCEYFNTVLGPGYNHDHRDHFHFDIKQRRNGYRACR